MSSIMNFGQNSYSNEKQEEHGGNQEQVLQNQEQQQQCNQNMHTDIDIDSSSNAIAAKRPYKCHACTKSFSRPSALKTHSYTHTGERPFECTIDNCGKKFSVISNLRRHLKTHRKPPAQPHPRLSAAERLRKLHILMGKVATTTTAANATVNHQYYPTLKLVQQEPGWKNTMDQQQLYFTQEPPPPPPPPSTSSSSLDTRIFVNGFHQPVYQYHSHIYKFHTHL